MDKVTIVFVLGAPGSGKGTQCTRIVEKYGWTHLSTGDLLREEVQAGTELGQAVEETLATGQMVPTDMILDLLTNAMASSGATRFLIDGFPRTLEQLMEFQTQVKPCDGVLVFSVPEEVAVERLLARGAVSGRTDDADEDTIRERMNVFWAESQPVIDFLADSGSDVHEVDSAAAEEAVFEAVSPFMDAMDQLAAAKEDGRPTGREEGELPLADMGGPIVEGDAPAAQDAAGEGGEAGEAGEGAEGEDAAPPADGQEGEEPGQEPGQEQPAGEGEGEGEGEGGEEGQEGQAPEGQESAGRLADGAAVVVLVLGAPGSDEIVQCELVRQRYGWTYLSVTDLLREEIERGTELGQQAAEVLVAGETVPPEFTSELLARAIEAVPRPLQKFVVEGLPRQIEHLEALQSLQGGRPLDSVLLLSVPEEVALVRLLARGGEEDEEGIRQRTEAFWAESQPLLDWLREQGVNVADIDASGDPDEVFGQVAEVLDAFGPPLPPPPTPPPPPEEAEQGSTPPRPIAESEEQAGAGPGGGEEFTDEQVQAAITIQAARRGYQDRKRVAALREAKKQQDEEAARAAEGAEAAEGQPARGGAEGADGEEFTDEQEQAAIRIQAAMRGHKDRQRVAQLREEKRLQEEQQREQEGAAEGGEEGQPQAASAAAAEGGPEEFTDDQVQAAITIQAARRGYQDRKRVAALREAKKQQEEEEAATRAAEGAEAEDPAGAGPGAGDDGARPASGRGGGAGEGLSYDEAMQRIQAAGRGFLDRKKGEEEGEEGGDQAAAAAEAEAAAAAAAKAEADARAAEEAEARAAEAEARAAAAEARAAAAEARARAEAEAAEVEARALELVSAIRGMLVVCGPSGVGKGTLIGRLMAEHADKFGFSVSHTTRGPRPGEQDGVHYHFTNREAMERDVSKGLFLEYADVHGNMYGTSLAGVAEVGRSGRIAVLDIDVQGATKIKASRAAGKARYLFIDPPSLEVLEARLRGRGTETEDKVRLRLANATAEIERSREPGFFNARIVNDDFDVAYHCFKNAIEALMPGTFTDEELRPPPSKAPEDAAMEPEEPPAAAAPPPQPPAYAAAAPPPLAGGGLSGGNSAYSMGAVSPSSAAPPGAGAAAALPVRQYMDATVVPVLREALRSLNEVRPEDPLKFVADYLLEARANGGRHPRSGGNGKTAGY